MQASPTAEARAWIVSLSPGTFFRTDAVPGPPTVVRPMLTRMLQQPQPIIGRAIRGLYYREPPPCNPRYGKPYRSATVMARAWFPPGSGLSDHSALSAVGWTRQGIVSTTVAVTRGGLTAPDLPGQGCRIKHRSNPRRNALTWEEVTLLEACRSFVFCDCLDWEHAMQRLNDAMQRLRARFGSWPDACLRRDMFLWAAETERPRRPGFVDAGSDAIFGAVVARLHRDLPDTLPTTA